MKRITLLFTILLLCLLSIANLQAQTLSFGPDIQTSKDERVAEIAKYWESYIIAQGKRDYNPDSTQFWSKKNQDLLRHAISPNFSIYNDGQHVVQSIRKVNEIGLYEINSTYKIKIPISEIPIFFMLYKTYVTESETGYQLHNYFDVTKNSLQHRGDENIEFYFSSQKSPDKRKIKESLDFYDSFTDAYNLEPQNKITFIVANSTDEAWQMLGVPYTVYRSEKSYAGLVIYPSMILTSRENHIHELVHAILFPLYPRIPMWINEGMATYYGRVNNNDYKHYIPKFKAFLAENSDINIFDRETLNMQIDDAIGVQYIVGAMFVDHIIKEYGHEKLKQIFACTSTEEILMQIEVEPEFTNSWFKELITNYK